MFDTILGIVLIILGLLVLWIKYKVVFGSKKYPVVIENVENQSRGNDESLRQTKKMVQVDIEGKKVYLQASPLLGNPYKKIGQKLEVYYNQKYPYEAVVLKNIGNEILAALCICIGLYLLFSA
jgi:hypothetical protein